MKTLKYIIAITFIALVVFSNTAKASNYSNGYYESVRTVAHNSQQIKIAAGDIDQYIVCKFWGTSMKYKGHIKLETKDNKYRLSFNEMRNTYGVLLSDLPQKVAHKSCKKAMIEFDEKLYNKINNWKDF